MRRFAAALLLAACAAPGPDAGPRSPREPAAPPTGRGRLHKFRVEATQAATEIRRDRTLKEIARMPGAAGSGLKTQGLTTIKHSLATHTRFSTARGDSAVYAWFDDVILELAVSSVVIHMPREYAPGSCEYEIVLAHERGHGRVAREQAVKAAAELEDALGAAEGLPTRFDPVIAPDFEAAARVLKAAIGKVIDPVYDRYERNEAEAQKALDRPDPYDAVYRKCTGWR
ncbi:MAG: hypothetical protein M0D55_08180 [Elusimicrobiota bacterium]|nr:MAG: hypothetical protein M0D55_08180 [Elusimicrobiota bacterium]